MAEAALPPATAADRRRGGSRVSRALGALARRMFDAYRAQGGAGELHLLPAFGKDGHALFRDRLGAPLWRSPVDAFLRQRGLPAWDAPPAEG